MYWRSVIGLLERSSQFLTRFVPSGKLFFAMMLGSNAGNYALLCITQVTNAGMLYTKNIASTCNCLLCLIAEYIAYHRHFVSARSWCIHIMLYWINSASSCTPDPTFGGGMWSTKPPCLSCICSFLQSERFIWCTKLHHFQRHAMPSIHRSVKTTSLVLSAKLSWGSINSFGMMATKWLDAQRAHLRMFPPAAMNPSPQGWDQAIPKVLIEMGVSNWKGRNEHIYSEMAAENCQRARDAALAGFGKFTNPHQIC